MDSARIIRHFVSHPPILASVGEREVPGTPGIYGIFVDAPGSLPDWISGYLNERGNRLLYVGKAGDSLLRRLVAQDLRGDGHSTFFRGLGAVLGFTPAPGSLIGHRNQNNYVFSPPDTARIVRWINTHLQVSWVELALDEPEAHEAAVIAALRPPFNDRYNPDRLEGLRLLRAECRRIAKG